MKMYIFIRARVQRKKKTTSVRILQQYILQHENSLCLASDPQRKTSVSHAGQFEKDGIRHQPVFRPEVPPAPSTWKRPVREAKFYLKSIPVETQTLTFTMIIIIIIDVTHSIVIM